MRKFIDDYIVLIVIVSFIVGGAILGYIADTTRIALEKEKTKQMEIQMKTQHP